MKTTILCLALGVVAAPVLANANNFAAACTKQNLNIGVKMAEAPFFRQFHNQDLVTGITQLRRSAEADMAAGNMESCGIKAATVSAMAKDPSHARVTLADYQSRQAASTGAAVVNTQSVAPGHHFTQSELIGTPLKSLNNETLGTITGVVYSQTGQPLYVTITPDAAQQLNMSISSLVVPVGLLLVGNTPGNMYVSLNSGDFWNEPRFRDVQSIQPAD